MFQLLTIAVLLLTLLFTQSALAYDAQELDNALAAPLESLQAAVAERQRSLGAMGTQEKQPADVNRTHPTTISTETAASSERAGPSETAAAALRPAMTQSPSTDKSAYGDLYNVIPNFKEVTAKILRGGQPTVAGIEQLKAAGVRTIINLRNEEVLVRKEQQLAASAGIKFINIPLDVFNAPPDSAIKEFCRVLDNNDSYPIYIHCLHGQDRTATMVALYRVIRENWDANRAYQEMLATGFRPGFSRLSQAVFASGAKLGRPGTPPSGADIIEDIKRRVSNL